MVGGWTWTSVEVGRCREWYKGNEQEKRGTWKRRKFSFEQDPEGTEDRVVQGLKDEWTMKFLER